MECLRCYPNRLIPEAILLQSRAQTVIHDDFNTDRRRFLVGTVAVAAGLELGCSKTEPVATPDARSSRIVPLRILLVGDEGDRDLISRGWQAVSEQEIEVDVLPLERSDPSGMGDAFLAAAKKADVVIYPLALVGEAARSEAVVEMTADEVKRIESEIGSLLPTARNGAARYGGATYALPLGCALPALIAQSSLQPLDSWEDYDALVQDEWEGLAAEPTAEGWAGTMFLWRSSGVKKWLFERKDLTPLIHTEPYVKSLELMLQTNSRYLEKDKTPDQIWAQVGEGKLRGGIGFPQRRSGPVVDLQLSALPGTATLSKVVLDPFAPVVSLSANCRQTSASRRFIQWMCGGEGSRAVRSQVAGMNDLRDRVYGSEDSAPYDRWLAEQLQAPLIAPCPQLNHAMEYLMVLDQQVRRALVGDAAPQEALDAVAEKWTDLTASSGADEQIRAWRMAQGMRA